MFWEVCAQGENRASSVSYCLLRGLETVVWGESRICVATTVALEECGGVYIVTKGESRKKMRGGIFFPLIFHAKKKCW